MKDNPNPLANIGFICFTPFDYFVYKNIHTYLPNSEFIIGDNYGGLDPQQEEERQIDLGKFLSQKKVYWRYIPTTSPKYLSDSYGKYGVLVSLSYKGSITEEYTNEIKKVRVVSSTTKDNWNFGPWNCFFDLVLIPGLYSHNELYLYGNTRIIGTPQYDELFGKKNEKSARKNFVKKKKTLLYFPKNGILSSHYSILAIMKKLSKEYRVVVIFHHKSFLQEKEIIQQYKKAGISVSNETDDTTSFLKDTSIVVSDRSEIMFDMVALGIPFMFIESDPHSYIQNTFFDQQKDIVLQKDAVEKRVRSLFLRLLIDDSFKNLNVIQQYKQFVEILSKSLDGGSFLLTQKERLKKEIFLQKSNYGKLAANEINSLLYSEKPKKNYFSLSMITYIQSILQQQQEKIEWETKNQTVLFYGRIRSLPVLHRIYFIYKEFF